MLSEEWKKYKLGDLAEITSSKRIFLSDYVEEGIPFYRSKEIIEKANGGEISVELFISEEKYFEIKQKFGAPVNGDLLIAAVGERAGIPYWVANDDDFYFKDGNLIWFKNFNKAAHSKFLYYYFRTKYGQLALESTMIGSAQRALTIIGLKNLEVNFPPIELQTEIVSILSSLDDKIELNLQMNKTLEAIAQAIFKEWFIDFRFPGSDGELVDGLPKGWTELPIGSLFTYNVGGDWGKEEPSVDFPIRVAIIRGTDFSNIQNGDISRVPIRYTKKGNLEKKKIENGDILLEISGGSNDQPTGRAIVLTDPILGLFDCPIVPASFCRLIRPFDFNHSTFLSTFFSRFYALGGTWEYQNQSTGISNFQFRYFSEDKKLALPNNDFIINEFGKTIRPLIEKQAFSIAQINNLTKIRDLLLPKLMTGKIKVA